MTDNEGMAECMLMLREDLIKAGVINASVPPMMMTEAVLGAIVTAVRGEREACAEVAESAMSDANKYDIADEIRNRSNAEVSGDGTASAGLPGYAGNNKGD